MRNMTNPVESVGVIRFKDVLLPTADRPHGDPAIETYEPCSANRLIRLLESI
jgi:hypothetical protein